MPNKDAHRLLTYHQAEETMEAEGYVESIHYSQRMEAIGIKFNRERLATVYQAQGMPLKQATAVAKAVAESTYYARQAGNSEEGEMVFEFPIDWIDLTKNTRRHFTDVFDELGLRQERIVV